MSYRIQRDESIADAIRRIAEEQLRKGLAEIDDPKLDRHETVHQVRKRCKKLRGLVRLTRPAFEATYRSENTAFRDAARLVSEVRDAATVIETYDALMVRFADQINREAFGPLRGQLTRRLNDLSSEQIDQQLGRVAEAFSAATDRLNRWTLDEQGFDAVASGLSKTRRRAIKRLNKAQKDPTTDKLHELRKRVKYHWYHMRLLRNLWPKVNKVWTTELDFLSDLLGDDHDLAVFRQRIDAIDHNGIDATDRNVLGSLIDQRRKELQRKAFRSAALLFAESDKAFTKRMRVYWNTMRFGVTRDTSTCDESVRA